MIRSSLRVLAVLSLVLATSALDVRAQFGNRVLGGTMKYNTGQTIQPIFDGWSRNPDGTFTLHFGYLNRNYVEELQIPIGPENTIEPGGPDRGQPTYFYTRFNRRAFTIVVPKDFGKKELVWTLTTRGKGEQAIGILQPDWEISVNARDAGASLRPDSAIPPNAPPTITVAASTTRLDSPASVTLTATVKDDGQPGPAVRARRSTDGVPAFQHEKSPGTTPTNLPQLERTRPRVNGRLTVTWIVWRGPAPVTFDPPVSGTDGGPTTVTASFAKPGSYVLRAIASDRIATALSDVPITVGTP